MAELLTSPLESDIPIATDAFVPLLEKGQEAALYLPGEPMGNVLIMDPPEETKWYNDWRVWTVAGGVLTTVLLLTLTNRNDPVTTGTTGIRIEFE